MARLPAEFEFVVDKLVFGGEGLGYFEGRPIFVVGVLPGERVLVVPARVSSKFAKARLLKVVEPSPIRIEPQESQYLSTSPWQIMPVTNQQQFKIDLVKEVFSKFASLPVPDVELTPSTTEWGYRNKMEFSFAVDEKNQLALAFHQRYSWKIFVIANKVSIAHPLINEVANKIIAELKGRDIPLSKLKNLLVRYSYYQNKCLAALYVTDEKFTPFNINLPELSGWLVVYSDPKSPIAKTTEILHQTGSAVLVEKVGDKLFQYGYESFFQINPPSFMLAASRMLELAQPHPQSLRALQSGGGEIAAAACGDLAMTSGDGVLVDLYAGAGIIGMLLADKYKQVVSVEFDPAGTLAAKANIKLNQLKNVELVGGRAEKEGLPSILSGADTVVVDPPREGLHQKVVEKIIEAKPKQLIYLSCNPATQARDWKLLSEKYQATHWELFDFYPQTPHVESLIVAVPRE
ncbi:23S rRNA (uracil(1939)-C(5))-methyltransferase RlmD [Patescibacteria group bacterium]|nr:23S rRNA (uracil(1939)-C(5))-methyltransferase RlmD [Patescibacteria group bacterium]